MVHFNLFYLIINFINLLYIGIPVETSENSGNVSLSGPKYVSSVEKVNLTCMLENNLTPSVFTWQGINCSIVSSLSATSSTCTFTPDNLGQDGTIVTCTANSTGETAKYTLLYAFGPRTANIIGPDCISENNLGQNLTLTCKTDVVHPNATYFWSLDGSNCSTEQVPCSTRSETLTLALTTGHVGSHVTCTATNSRDRNVSSTATYKITFACAAYPTVIAGAAVGGSIIFILAITVVSAILIKRRKVTNSKSASIDRRETRGSAYGYECVDQVNVLYVSGNKTPMTLSRTHSTQEPAIYEDI